MIHSRSARACFTSRNRGMILSSAFHRVLAAKIPLWMPKMKTTQTLSPKIRFHHVRVRDFSSSYRIGSTLEQPGHNIATVLQNGEISTLVKFLDHLIKDGRRSGAENITDETRKDTRSDDAPIVVSSMVFELTLKDLCSSFTYAQGRQFKRQGQIENKPPD